MKRFIRSAPESNSPRGRLECMRRLVHYLFTILSALSLAIFLALCLLWLRSWFGFDEFSHITWNGSTGRHSQRTVAWDRGRLFLAYRSMDLPIGRNYTQLRLPAPMFRHRMLANSTGQFEFTWWEAEFGGAGVGQGWVNRVFDRSYQVAMVMWPLMPLAMIFPAVWLRRSHRYRKLRAVHRGCCPSCGYDMCATPDRCPECGTIPAKAIA
jgi:hypothetical protein